MLRRWISKNRPALAVGLLALIVAAPFVQQVTAQPASRYALTASLWERRSVNLDAYQRVIYIDRAYHNGSLRSDKAPGQPFLAVPFYGLYSAVSGESTEQPCYSKSIDELKQEGQSCPARTKEHLGYWWLTIWTSVIPFAGILLLAYRVALEHDPAGAGPATIAIGFGSLLLPFSTQLYAHVLAAFLGFAAWYVLRREHLSVTRLAGAGALMGLAVAVEYPMALLGLACGLFVVKRAGWKIIWYALGSVPFGLAVMAYNQAAFDNPLRLSYSTKESIDKGLFGIGLPDPSNLLDIFFGGKGLLLGTPIVLLAIGLGVYAVWKRDPGRKENLFALAIFTVVILVPAGWENPWGGETAGSRYLIPALPFLVIPLARGWQKMRALATGVSVVSILLALGPTVTLHLVGEGGNPLPIYRERLIDGDTMPTLFTMAIGPAGWLVHAFLVVMTSLWVIRELRDAKSPDLAQLPA